MADSREVMNIRQASQYLGVSPDTLYKYVNEQKIPAFKLGNRWRFKKSKLDQWMEEKSMELEPRGKKSIKAVELRRTRTGIEVAHLGLEPIAPDIVVDSMIVDSGTVSSAIAKLFA